MIQVGFDDHRAVSLMTGIHQVIEIRGLPNIHSFEVDHTRVRSRKLKVRLGHNRKVHMKQQDIHGNRCFDANDVNHLGPPSGPILRHQLNEITLPE